MTFERFRGFMNRIDHAIPKWMRFGLAVLAFAAPILACDISGGGGDGGGSGSSSCGTDEVWEPILGNCVNMSPEAVGTRQAPYLKEILGQ
jgi:hypothetical protein